MIASLLCVYTQLWTSLLEQQNTQTKRTEKSASNRQICEWSSGGAIACRTHTHTHIQTDRHTYRNKYTYICFSDCYSEVSPKNRNSIHLVALLTFFFSTLVLPFIFPLGFTKPFHAERKVKSNSGKVYTNFSY